MLSSRTGLALAVSLAATGLVASLAIPGVPGSPVAAAAARAPGGGANPLAVPSPAVTAQLERAHDLAAGQRVRALVIGDSLALTLGRGLATDSTAWGVDVVDHGVLGCDLDPDSMVEIQDRITKAAQGCVDWRRSWAADIDRVDPDVVVIELGRWEVSRRLVDGKWTGIGHPAWDHLLARLLGQAIEVASRRGAAVVLLTLPYVKQTFDQPNGKPWGINRPVRTDQYNAIVRTVVAHHHRVASVIDLNHLLDPDGHYTSFVDGVRVRDTDEEHPSLAGGELLRPVVLPQLLSLGLSHERRRTGTAPTRRAADHGSESARHRSARHRSIGT